MKILKKLLRKLRRPPLLIPALQVTMTQELHTQTLSASYRIVSLAVTLHNRSPLGTLKNAVLTAALAQVAPLTDEEVKTLIRHDQGQPPIRSGSRYAWPPLPPGIGPHPALPERIPPDRRITRYFTFQIPAETTCVEATARLRSAAPADDLVSEKPSQSWQQIDIYDLPPTASKAKQSSLPPEGKEVQP